MLAHNAIIVSDAHLGQVPRPIVDAFHQFLATVPDMARHLVINGDLFDFWFEYGTVIPRSAFPTLAALDAIRRAGVRLTITGGNHDRWSRGFWQRELGASFHRDGAELELAGLRTLIAHGDRMDGTLGSRVLQAISRFPLTPALFRWIHPDVGISLVRRMSRAVVNDARRAIVMKDSSAAQEVYAVELLKRRPELNLLVFGHTHLPVLTPVGPGRWYANPGAWMDGLRYLVVTDVGPALQQFSPSTP